MKTKFIYTFFIVMFPYLSSGWAQAPETQRGTVEINTFPTTVGIDYQSDLIISNEIPIVADPFIAFSLVCENENWGDKNSKIWYRFYENSNEENNWIHAKADVHANNSKHKWISELHFENKKNKYIELKIERDQQGQINLNKLELHFFNPGKTEKKESNNQQLKTNSCPCPQPTFENRQDWCPAGNCPPNPDPSPTTVSHLIVHHSAGTNASSDWAGVVRSIWDYHVNTNGWSDIGYNWLVDPNGVLYEGRGDNILGAHFCGTNTATMGVCMMGDFTNISPTDDAKSMLTDLLSWKICDIDADPLGSSFHTASSQTLNHISGHKDGCATACPGDTFYPEFETVRNNVSDNIANNCEASGLLPPTNLEATVMSSTSIQLDWEDNSSNETTFVIERSTNNNSNYQQVGTTNTDIATFTDTNLTPNTAYFYKVKAINTQESSDYSNEVGIATVFTGTEDLENNFNLHLFPNPVANWLTVQANKPLELQLIDYSGKVIYNDFLEGSKKINMSAFSKGLYLLRVTDGEQVQLHNVMRF